MGNAFVNAFAALEPTTGRDGFSIRQNTRRPTAFFEARTGVNRLFRSNQAFLPDVPLAEADEPSEASSFVLDQFLKHPKMA